MTNSEAQKIRSSFFNGFQFPFGGGFLEKCDMGEVSRHATLMKEALEKQIPKSPVVDTKNPVYEENVLHYICSCPTCRECVGLDMKTQDGRFKLPFVHYCQSCGQRLDWEEIHYDKS